MSPQRRLGETPVTLKYILLCSDISLACFVLGCGLILWGIIAGIMSPKDVFTFAGDMAILNPVFWVANYIALGSGFIYVTMRSFPNLPSLFVGGYGTVIWSWIAAYRGSANFTSGVTLNVIVILMSIILIQRSRRNA